MPPTLRPGFKVEWPPVRPAVHAYCTRRLRDHHLAEDITQRTAIQASKHYDTFLGQTTFLSWVKVIARHMMDHEFPKRQRRAKRETPLDPAQHASIQDESCPPPLAEDLSGLPSLGQMIATAAATDWVIPVEVDVVRLRLLEPRPSWGEIGEKLGLSAMAAKLHHHRARLKLQVTLLMHLRVNLSGAELIAEAFATARKYSANPMSAAEIEVFDEVVVRHVKSHLLSGAKEVLIAACHKVVECFERGLAGGLMNAIAHGGEEK